MSMKEFKTLQELAHEQGYDWSTSKKVRIFYEMNKEIISKKS